MANRTVVTREAVERAMAMLREQGRPITLTAVMALTGGTKPKVFGILSDIEAEEKSPKSAEPEAAELAVDPSDGSPAELPDAVHVSANALMAALTDCLTVTIRRERDRARRELDAEREAHRAALESERLAYEARAKALQGQIDALTTLRAKMRDELEEAGNEQERLQDLLETAEQARRDTEDTLEQTRARRDELIAELDIERARTNQMEKDLLQARADAAELRGRSEARADALEEAKADARASLARAAVAEADVARLSGELERTRADVTKERQARDQASRPKRGGAGGVKAPVPVAPATGESSQPSQPTGPAVAGGPVGSA